MFLTRHPGSRGAFAEAIRDLVHWSAQGPGSRWLRAVRSNHRGRDDGWMLLARLPGWRVRRCL